MPKGIAAEISPDPEKIATKSDGKEAVSDSGDLDSVTVTRELEISNGFCSGGESGRGAAAATAGIEPESGEVSSDRRGRVSPGSLFGLVPFRDWFGNLLVTLLRRYWRW